MPAGNAAVLFDVDGTLVDSNYQHALAWWEALRQYGHTVPVAVTHRAVGMGTEQLLDHVLGEGRDRSETGDLAAAHDALAARYWPALTPLPGAADLVRACAQRGWRTVLASSASARELRVLSEILDVDDALAAATSGDDVEDAKPAPDIVGAALRKVSGDPQRSVMVGDTVWDVRAARRAGVSCIGVLTGGFSRQELHTAGAVEVYESTSVLLENIDGSALAHPSAV
jgi:HAD superfamily hydrolase (TIGR01509 family)